LQEKSGFFLHKAGQFEIGALAAEKIGFSHA
jgi:hypothetical protein